MTTTELTAMLALMAILILMSACATQVIAHQEKRFDELDEINRLREEL